MPLGKIPCDVYQDVAARKQVRTNLQSGCRGCPREYLRHLGGSRNSHFGHAVLYGHTSRWTGSGLVVCQTHRKKSKIEGAQIG